MSITLPQKQVVLSNDTQVKDRKINVDDRDGVTLLPVLMRSSAGYISMLVTSKQENPVGFRKIEPKPSAVEETNAGAAEAEIKDFRRKRKGNPAVRFLGSNATRRGVRICVTCNGRIGFRSKMCKHCLKLPATSKNSSSNGLMVKTLLQQKLLENTHVVSNYESKDGKENGIKECENAIDRPLTADYKHGQINGQTTENVTILSAPISCSADTLGKNRVGDVSDTLRDNRQDTEQNKLGLPSDEVTHMVAMTSVQSQQERNDIQEKISMQAEHTSQGNMPGHLCQSLKQENSDNFTSSLNHCSVSTNNLTEYVHFEDKSFSDILATDTSRNEKKPRNPLKIGNKRRQKTYPSRKRKQRKVCSEIQFMRIEPKPCLKEEGGKDCSEDVDEGKIVGNKLDNVRFLTSNPTRRGIMPCPMCQKEVGCRSKTCKHCKVVINFSKSKALDNNNLLIVQLSPLTNPEYIMFSVKKSISPSEERCFIRQAATKDDPVKETMDSTHGFSWVCECVENDSFSETPICEHAKCFYRNPKIVQARTVVLIDEKIDCLPIDSLFKNKLKELWESNKKKERPLVQQVALNTLVVLDIEKDMSGSSADSITCVHIRFVKVKRHRFVQPHIFCSGKSCSYWSPLEGQGESPITCLHYCISLWAIASDNELHGYYKVFLEAPQVYLHSEVFDTVVTS